MKNMFQVLADAESSDAEDNDEIMGSLEFSDDEPMDFIGEEDSDDDDDEVAEAPLRYLPEPTPLAEPNHQNYRPTVGNCLRYADPKQRWACPSMAMKPTDGKHENVAPAPAAEPEVSDQRGIAKKVLHYLGLARSNGGNLNALPATQGQWERLESVVDSGATVSVMGPEFAREYDITPSEASKAGVTYQVANGDEIDNLGEKFLPVITDEGTMRGVISQVAKVTSPLTSVRQLYNSGHLVVFDGPESFIMNKLTGELNMIQDNGTNYTIGMWVVPKDALQGMEAEGFGRPAP